MEAVAVQAAVCFGPHMDDFNEIAAELVASGGALQIEPASIEALKASLQQLVQDKAQRFRLTQAANTWLESRQGVVERHLALITPHFQQQHR